MIKICSLILLMIGLLVGCSDHNRRELRSPETHISVPKENVLGPIASLPPISENEIGFFLGKGMASDDRVIVTLTRQDYLCRTNGGKSVARSCAEPKLLETGTSGDSEITRLYTDKTESTWIYAVADAPKDEPLASCRKISGEPGGGRCFTEGRYKDLAYSAIFYDGRLGGALKVRADVELQIKRWDSKAG